MIFLSAIYLISFNNNDFLYYLFRNREFTTSYAKAKFIGMFFEAEKEIDIAAIALVNAEKHWTCKWQQQIKSLPDFV